MAFLLGQSVMARQTIFKEHTSPETLQGNEPPLSKELNVRGLTEGWRLISITRTNAWRTHIKTAIKSLSESSPSSTGSESTQLRPVPGERLKEACMNNTWGHAIVDHTFLNLVEVSQSGRFRWLCGDEWRFLFCTIVTLNEGSWEREAIIIVLIGECVSQFMCISRSNQKGRNYTFG